MYFTTMGSARSIRKGIKQLGADAINPVTGRVVTDMAVFWSMWRFAFENLDLTYEIFNDAMRDEGKFYTKAEWEEFVNEKAKLIAKKSDRSFTKWQKRVNLTKNGQTMPAS